MPPVCWCTGLLGWVWVIGLIAVPAIWIGMAVEEIRARRRGDR